MVCLMCFEMQGHQLACLQSKSIQMWHSMENPKQLGKYLVVMEENWEKMK